MAITAAMVKELRDKTDAGMMDCKKALTETNGDMDAAVEYLRKAGITKAEKRSERQTKEGRIYVASEGNKAVMIEITFGSSEKKRTIHGAKTANMIAMTKRKYNAKE